MRGELGSIDATVYVAIKEFFMHEVNGREGSTVTSGSKTSLCEKYKKKFIGESKNLSKLKNSHIIKVVESFDANDTVYYAMEYIDGGSLDEQIANDGCIPEKQTLKLASQIASAMAFMHSQKMLHLDLKPSNVMMRSEDDIVLIDFGLSKQFDENGNPESSTTIGGGTPGYSPIEQSNYSGDTSSGLPVTMDVYALGATMFKMLTGHKPPVASDLFNDGFPINELQVKNISPKTISLIEYAMHPQRGKRIQTMRDFKRLIDESTNSLNEGTVVDTDVNQQTANRRSRVQEPPKESFNHKSNNLHSKPATKISESKDNWWWTAIAIIIAVGGWILIPRIFSSANDIAEEDTIASEEVIPAEQLDYVAKQHSVANYSFHNSKGQTFTYTGTITADSIPTGNGTGVYSNGTYKGAYSNGLRHGEGSFDTSDGQNHFIGTFANDLYEKGTLTLADGMYFKGSFKSGNPYNGKWYTKSNKIYSTLTNGK